MELLVALADDYFQLVSFIVLLVMNRKLQGTIPIRIKKWTFHWWVYRDVLRSGIPSFFRQVLSATVGVMLNKYSAPFGDVAIAAMSIVSRVYQMIISLTVGFGQGFQPVCGFNYGAKRYDRVIQAFWFCVKVAMSALVVLGIVGFIFSDQIIAIFRKEDLEVIAIGATAIKLYSSAWWVMGLVIMCNMFFHGNWQGAVCFYFSIITARSVFPFVHSPFYQIFMAFWVCN